MSAIPIEVVIPILILGAKGAGAVMRLVQNRRRLRTWQEAAAACGLQVVETSLWSPRLTARAGPVAVTIEPYGTQRWTARIVVGVPAPPELHSVSIRREPLMRRAGEIEIGDTSFDSTFSIEGPMRQVLSLLDAETRRLLTCVNAESRLEISTGTCRAEGTDDEKIPYVLPLLLDIGRRFARSTDVARRLADNAKGDPEPGVRLQNLLLLIRELPEAPETMEALRTACSDLSPQVRLQAAKGVGAEGRDLLLDLAESLVDDAVSAEAVSTLDRELPFERTKGILDHALGGRLLKTARVCLEALGGSGDAGAEPLLIDALQRQEADLRIAAANALGRVGSADAVLLLQEAAELHWLDRELRQATRQAIAEIQSRLQGAAPGQLSLPAAEAGRLSLAADPIGRLSLPPEETEQPSPEARKEPVGRRA